tara:strand:- start:1014 stop:1382 length:369 start_codon:yes stop_codon:yes gene_type:complete
MVVTAIVGATAATVYTANKAANQQKKAQQAALAQQQKANEQALETAKAEEERAEVAYNQANQKQPEVAAIVSRSQEAATQGVASTVLTGKGKKGGGGGSLLTGQVGVDPSMLNLGGNTLLGS